MFFRHTFEQLTNNPPFPWQEALYSRFIAGDFPSSCVIPTGLGKTSIIAIWLIALASNPEKIPRRLVYVVNRRTVVDQTTEEIKTIRDNLAKASLSELRKLLAALNSTADRTDEEFNVENLLAISTLRGQFADNREWSADPSRAAVICGTVDMIGSRLLFSGYGASYRTRPLYAGFLGQDALLIHDEAHLEPAFQKLVNEVEKTQEQKHGEVSPFRVIELTATNRTDDTAGAKTTTNAQVFGLTPEDEKHPLVRKRLFANKTITLKEISDEKSLAEELCKLALGYKVAKTTVIVFARTVEIVEKIVKELVAAKQLVVALTGTMRGYERDQLVVSPVFTRFLTNAGSGEQTAYLVCTSAGEVGINISAEHLICDLSTFESMAQRLGRVNRFGNCDVSQVHIVYPSNLPSEEEVEAEQEKDSPKTQLILDGRRRRTLELLRSLRGDGSPKALQNLRDEDKQDAFSPLPSIPKATEILFDFWALTTITDKMPGRPSVEPYLHGVAEWQPPQTTVAWRDEVDLLSPPRSVEEESDQFQLQDLLDDYPLKPHEILRDRTDRVFKHLDKLAERAKEDNYAWVIDKEGKLQVLKIAALVAKDRSKTRLVDLEYCTVILPPSLGGLASNGCLDGSSETLVQDVADEWFDSNQIRLRIRKSSDDERSDTTGMRLIRSVPLKDPCESDDEAIDLDDIELRQFFVMPKSADDDGSSRAKHSVLLDTHTQDVIREVERITKALKLPRDISQALYYAAKFHDSGKRLQLWQRGIGNLSSAPLAKSGRQRFAIAELNHYRHEFGSLCDVYLNEGFKALPQLQQSLVLHLIAAHHGRGRPHFPEEESYCPPQALADEISSGAPLRFAELQRKYGRWGLAYLESLLRAADIAASRNPSEVVS